MEVEQVGESKVLMFHTTFTTEVRVVEDDSDPQRLRTEFELVRSVSANLGTSLIADLSLHNVAACNAVCHDFHVPECCAGHFEQVPWKLASDTRNRCHWSGHWLHSCAGAGRLAQRWVHMLQQLTLKDGICCTHTIEVPDVQSRLFAVDAPALSQQLLNELVGLVHWSYCITVL